MLDLHSFEVIAFNLHWKIRDFNEDLALIMKSKRCGLQEVKGIIDMLKCMPTKDAFKLAKQ